MRTHDDDDDTDDGGVAQDDGHPPNKRLTETCSVGLPCTLLIHVYDICYDQLTPFKSSYPLTSTM